MDREAWRAAIHGVDISKKQSNNPEARNFEYCINFVCVCVCACTHAKSLQLCLTLLGDLLNPGIEPVSVMNPALAGGLFTTSATCMGIFN